MIQAGPTKTKAVYAGSSLCKAVYSGTNLVHPLYGAYNDASWAVSGLSEHWVYNAVHDTYTIDSYNPNVTVGSGSIGYAQNYIIMMYGLPAGSYSALCSFSYYASGTFSNTMITDVLNTGCPWAIISEHPGTAHTFGSLGPSVEHNYVYSTPVTLSSTSDGVSPFLFMSSTSLFTSVSKLRMQLVPA